MTRHNKTDGRAAAGQAILRRIGAIIIGIAAMLAIYAAAGFWLAPYLVVRYAPAYASERLKAQVRVGQVRINPFLLTFEARGISLRQEGNKPLLALKRVFIDLELESLFRRAWIFADIQIEGPALDLAIGKDGRLNLARLVDSLARSDDSPQGKAQDKGKSVVPRLLLRHFMFSNGVVHVADYSMPEPAGVTISPVSLELRDLSTLPERCGAYTFSASLPEGGGLRWKGKLSLQPIMANGIIELKDFRSAMVWNFLRNRLNMAEPWGAASLSAGYVFAYRHGNAAFEVSPINLDVSQVSLAEKDAGQPVAEVASLRIFDGRLDVMKHQLVIPLIALNGVKVTVVVNKTGSANWQRLVSKPKPMAPAVMVAGPRQSAVKDGLPWRIGVNTVNIGDLHVHYNDAGHAAPMTLDMNLAKMSLDNGDIDSGLKEAAIKGLVLTDGEIIFERGAADPVKTIGKIHKLRVTGGDDAGTVKGQPWKFALNRLSMAGFRIGFVDHAVNPAIAYDLAGLRAEIKDFGDTSGKPVVFDVRTKVKQGGSANLNGILSQSGRQIDAQVRLSHLNLKPLDPLVKQRAALILASGDLSADTHVAVAMGVGRPSVAVKGTAGIGSLLLNEAGDAGRLLSWKELSARGLDFSLNPDHLAIKDVHILEPGAKIIIFRDKSLNLAKVIRPPNESRSVITQDRQEVVPVTKSQMAQETEERFPVAVGRVRLEKGVVDFADLSLVLPFSSRIDEFRGAATGISTHAGSRTSLRFEGRVGEFGQAKIEGSFAPSDPRRFTDISVFFRNVIMPPLSPYSATFAGRAISSGRLNLSLEYKIKDSKLLGDNKVVLQDFTLGKRVKSPGAMDLPLDLAIALLTDNDGKIDVALPVRGDLDNPEFSYGHIIWQAIFNLLSKIVTSPFRAMAALFGGTEQNLDTLMFEPGRADIPPPEQEKLKNVAAFLAKRRQLILIVHGGFDPVSDGSAIKSVHVRRALARQMGIKLKQDEDPGSVVFDDASTQRSIELLAGERTIAVFQAEYEKNTGEKVSRVNPAMALFGKPSKDTAFYHALFEYLIEISSLPQMELDALAEKRRTAVIQELTTHDGVDPARITSGDILQVKDHDKEVPVKLELGAH